MKHTTVIVLSLIAIISLSACSTTNKAVTTAAGGQIVGAAALVRCADIAAKHPEQIPPLTAMLNKAQAQIDAGSPFAALATIASENLSPDAQKSLAIVGLLLEQKMTSFMAAAQAAVSDCRMGILSQTGSTGAK